MQILNIAGYKFISLMELESLREQLISQCQAHALKGTILLSSEGINISLSGTLDGIQAFKSELISDSRFHDMTFHETYSDAFPFQRLKVKIKKEIITLNKPDANPISDRAPDISPQEFKRWMDEGKDFIVLDTRNDYEVQFGTFTHAVNLHIKDFGEFPQAVDKLKIDKPVVMFCTGGIRCEKAALHMLNQGHSDIYQLDGGILGYFAEVGGDHFQGECFVFDERISVDAELNATGTTLCLECQGPVLATGHACK